MQLSNYILGILSSIVIGGVVFQSFNSLLHGIKVIL